MQEQETIAADIEPLLQAVGLSLVEFVLSRHRGSVQVRAVIHAPEGTGVAECSKAHRIIYPRLQVLLAMEDPYLEVTSPGIERTIKSPREYGIFAGKGVKILLVNETEWIKGRIVALKGPLLDLSTKEGPMTIEIDAVAKARLDSTQEGD
ncbi:MAG: hypothetical protein JNG85_11110 [Spirochaetaceae bacterium]|nr:hypothetical protein [Spirochaetaceae bacterium]